MLEVEKNLPSWFLASVLLLILALVSYLLITGTSIRYGNGVLGFVSPAKSENSQDATHKGAVSTDITPGIDLTKLQQENKTIAGEKEKLETELEISREQIAEMGLALEKAKEEIKRLSSQKPTDIHAEVKEEIVTRLNESAVELGEEADRGLKWRIDSTGETAANSLVWEYNQLIKEATSLLETDLYIKSLKEADKERIPEVAASKIGRLAKELALYMTSFDAVKTLKSEANAIAIRANEGLEWRYDSTGETAANSLVGEYNYLVQRAKKLFSTVRTIQLLEEASQEQVPNVAAGKIKRLANNMERILASM